MKSLKSRAAEWRVFLRTHRPTIIVLEFLGISSAIAIAFIFHTPYWVMRNYPIIAAIPLALIVCLGEWYVAREFFKLSDHVAQNRFKVRFGFISIAFIALSFYHLYVDNFVIERITESLAIKKRDKGIAELDSFPNVAIAMKELKSAESLRDAADKRAKDFDAQYIEYFSRGRLSKFEKRQDELAAKVEDRSQKVDAKRREWLATREKRKAEIEAEFQAEKNRGLVRNWLAFLEHNPSGAILLAVFVFVIALDTREREFNMVGATKDPLDEIPVDLDGCAMYLAGLPDSQRRGLQRRIIDRGVFDDGQPVKEWTLSRRIKAILEAQESVDALQKAANLGKPLQTEANNGKHRAMEE